MASIIIQRSWPDGDELTVSVDVDDSFPDVVAEARKNAVDLYRDALGLTLTGNESGDS